MEVYESIENYHKLKLNYTINEVENLVALCTKLGMNQKTITNCIYTFYYVRNFLKIEPDDITLYTSIIDMCYKNADVSKSLENILKSCSIHFLIPIDEEAAQIYLEYVTKTQLRILKHNACDLYEINLHEKMIARCKEQKVDPTLSDMCWVFLNDLSILCPSTLFFTEDEVVMAAFYVLFLYNKETMFKDVPPEKISRNYRGVFAERFDMSEDEMKAVEFLAAQLVELYEASALQSK